MRLTPDVVDVVQIVVNLGCAGVAMRTWRRQGGPAAGWLTATFGVLSLVFLAATMLPVHSERALFAWARKLVVVGLLLFPYCLYRFTSSFDGARRRSDRLAAGITVAVMAVTVVIPNIPERGEARPDWWPLYLGAVLVQWSALSAVVAVRLWRAGRNEATVARRRMQLMALGTVVLDMALLMTAASPEGDRLASHLVALFGIVLLVVGFVPPPFLRTAWRRPEVRAVRNAEVALMAAVSAVDVANALLPHVTRLLGGTGSVLLDTDDVVVGVHDLTYEEARAAADAPEGTPGILGAPLNAGRIVVQASPYTPFFGGEELGYLQRFAMLTDLALARAALLSDERASRERAERAHAELETFVYTVSHDLKSPLVSMAGFLDLLRMDLGGDLPGDTPFYLDRMASSTTYMQALIRDLLELSRIGRVDAAVARVDLGAVAREAAAEATSTHPQAMVEVAPLPVVSFNPLRARQLFTNLVCNAVAHGGRPDIHVTVTAEHGPGGSLRVRVADDGVGIPAEHREAVFGVFERLGKAGASGGTGIGLAVCRKIVEQRGGTIRVGDSAVGCTFEIDLPPGVVLSTSGGAASFSEARP